MHTGFRCFLWFCPFFFFFKQKTAYEIQVWTGVQTCALPIWLVHVEEAAKVHAANVQSANADGRVRQRLEFEGQAGLHAVRVLVILVEADNHGRPKKSAVGDGLARGKRIREWVRGVVRIRSVLYEALQR